ncbi:hypothetical protein AB990_03795 [Alkalihalobacillus pseudalcaliphilus]|nr:hypothetical protein AB990_03795 [Alkalihalobacillus pseudalcaliphilus]
MKEFGLRFNLAESTISGYENGSRMPDAGIINKFADFFDVNTDYLLGRTDIHNNIESQEQQLDNKIEEAMNDPDTEIFFKDYLNAPEEKKAELRRFFKYIIEDEKKEE